MCGDGGGSTQMKIQVTQGDIAEAERHLFKFGRNYADHCPVACAITRITKAHCSVNARDILIGGTLVSWTPPEVADFINKWDIISTRAEVKPFEFELELK